MSWKRCSFKNKSQILSKVSEIKLDVSDKIKSILKDFDDYTLKIKENLNDMNKLIDKGRESFQTEPEVWVMQICQ